MEEAEDEKFENIFPLPPLNMEIFFPSLFKDESIGLTRKKLPLKQTNKKKKTMLRDVHARYVIWQIKNFFTADFYPPLLPCLTVNWKRSLSLSPLIHPLIQKMDLEIAAAEPREREREREKKSKLQSRRNCLCCRERKEGKKKGKEKFRNWGRKSTVEAREISGPTKKKFF